MYHANTILCHIYHFLKTCTFISDSVSKIIDILQECSQSGTQLVLDMEEALFEKGLLRFQDETTLVALEHSLLEVAANQDVAQGVFYMLPFYYEEKLFIR